jgi:hypothetical protein
MDKWEVMRDDPVRGRGPEVHSYLKIAPGRLGLDSFAVVIFFFFFFYLANPGIQSGRKSTLHSWSGLRGVELIYDTTACRPSLACKYV